MFQDNAHVTAGGAVVLNSGRDTTVAGAVVTGETVDLTVGRDLTIASRQDREASESASRDGSVSLSQSGGSLSLSGSTGSRDRAWVEEQTAILGADSVDAYVEGTTTITGGILAAEAEGGATLDTGSLVVADLEDHDRSRQSSAGVSLGTGSGTLGPLDGITGSNFTADREQINRGTIGTGEVTVRDQTAAETETRLATVNRDLDAAQEVTRDERSGFRVFVDAKGLGEAQALFDSNVQGALEAGLEKLRTLLPENQKGLADELASRCCHVWTAPFTQGLI